ncbi:hypothetical protein A2U01_0117632, partial [Trifolium medium]|nr:hypothetical protein [Trifolium medium]
MVEEEHIVEDEHVVSQKIGSQGLYPPTEGVDPPI